MKKSIKKVFVSGCYDIIHAGHIQFFEEAKALGDHLTVCFASSEVLMLVKGRVSSLPDLHKEKIISSIKCVDRVLSSSNLDPIFDYLDHWKKEAPHILAITEDDKNIEEKKKVCAEYGVMLVILPKTRKMEPVSTTSILAKIKKVNELPLRVDFGGGWLDVPSLSRKNAFIVNCTVTPKVSLENWPYEQGAGLGGSAAFALLNIKDGIKSEINLGVGWQDPAVIQETGLCVWRSGKEAVLETKYNPDWLFGKMLIIWTGKDHSTPNIMKMKRNYKLIQKAGILAKDAVSKKDIVKLGKAVITSYKAQLGEGMDSLPKIKKSIGWKYLGGGHGGYALYIFKTKKDRDAVAKTWKNNKVKIIEPYIEVKR